MSSQSEVVTNEATKSGLFEPSEFQKEPGVAQRIAKERVFDAKNHEESIGHDFKALSRAILPEIDDLCKLPSQLHTEKGLFSTL